MTWTIPHLRKTQATTQKIFWLLNLETICNTSFFYLSLDGRVLVQLKLCIVVVIQAVLLHQLRFLALHSEDPTGTKTSWWLLLIGTNIIQFFCSYNFLLSSAHHVHTIFLTILCIVLLSSKVDGQFSCEVSVILSSSKIIANEHPLFKWICFISALWLIVL